MGPATANTATGSQKSCQEGHCSGTRTDVTVPCPEHERDAKSTECSETHSSYCVQTCSAQLGQPWGSCSFLMTWCYVWL